MCNTFRSQLLYIANIYNYNQKKLGCKTTVGNHCYCIENAKKEDIENKSVVDFITLVLISSTNILNLNT